MSPPLGETKELKLRYHYLKHWDAPLAILAAGVIMDRALAIEKAPAAQS